MIDAIVRGPLDVHDEDLLEDLASRFDVSVQALTYRLTNLGLSFGHGDTPARHRRLRRRR
jgi:Zn-dependent peptidase ImmA (M78 family)